MHTVIAIARVGLGLLLAAFFGFVGWMKAFAPLAELRLHHAWTVWLPEPLGRAVGWSELIGAALLALALLVPRLARHQRAVAVYFIVNQMAAATTHFAVGEHGALPQNAVLTVAFAALAVSARPAAASQSPRERTA